jgi:hypothetical protein
MPMVITIMKTSLMTTFKMEVGDPFTIQMKANNKDD